MDPFDPKESTEESFKLMCLLPCQLWPSKASAFSTPACAIALWTLAIVYLPDLATKMNDFLLLTWIHLDDASNRTLNPTKATLVFNHLWTMEFFFFSFSFCFAYFIVR
ncbi:hypothetical protein ACN42_g3270 [Penicillium freii]|uniref:Uncharacterized protein n=1 Tax=Penicillium freii TaxID=48697 RepID=A0A117NQC2_PENFR|nr:hypothetical protein ACN42_g3270 [Penicillium freii]